MSRKSFTAKFDPSKKGLRKILGKLETEIMEIAWERGSVTVREVHELLQEKREIAYTTVMTVMSRLAEKGTLERVRDGLAFVYKPQQSKDEFTRGNIKNIIRELLRDFSTPVIHQFVESIEQSQPEKMEELAKLIESKRKKKHA